MHIWFTLYTYYMNDIFHFPYIYIYTHSSPVPSSLLNSSLRSLLVPLQDLELRSGGADHGYQEDAGEGQWCYPTVTYPGPQKYNLWFSPLIRLAKKPLFLRGARFFQREPWLTSHKSNMRWCWVKVARNLRTTGTSKLREETMFLWIFSLRWWTFQQ